MLAAVRVPVMSAADAAAPQRSAALPLALLSSSILSLPELRGLDGPADEWRWDGGAAELWRLRRPGGADWWYDLGGR